MNRKGILAILILLLFSCALSAAQDEVVAIKGGTILTVTKGTIENGVILIQNGKIIAVGADVEIPANAKVIDATGKFVMPGIIDGHSHIALDDDINEMTSPVTAQVEMINAVVPDDYSIYQALAGGVTAAKLMHGSANVIGGVNVTVKMKWGKPVKEMMVPGVRPQIKMALGENPKRVYGSRNQMPSTRPGEFAILRQKFIDAREYKQKWDEYRAKVDKGEKATAPKRDLQMDTLAAVLEGKIAIDCHCYSANEIVVLLGIKKEFNLPLVSLSHALEAYKVRDEIAKSGVVVQTHTDWWGFKWEAFDAIPYNLGMLQEAGVTATIISDSGDVMRRLNREAAKVVKYSGVSDDVALAMITINAAKALEMDKITGSIEVGKDGDIAIFDRHPLDSFSKCVMTIIEGKVWFDINHVKTALLD